MFTNKKVEYLLNLEKRLKNPTQVINLNNNLHILELYAPTDKEYDFRIDISTNSKIILKASFHHMESNSFIGLLRIDFKGRHSNPNTINEFVPHNIKQYVGRNFDIDEPHMHIFIQGYRPLAWAIPLTDTKFKNKEFKEYEDLSEIIFNFAKEVNLTSKFLIQVGLL